MEFKNLYDRALGRSETLPLQRDWRKIYTPVASVKNFNPAYNEMLQKKLTDAEIILQLKKRIKDLKKWRLPQKGKNIKEHSSKLSTTLYEFCDTGGVMVIPYETWFWNTEEKIEEQIQKKYPDLVDWNLQLDSIEKLKRYYKMKEELLAGLTQRDFKDVLYMFYENGWFHPQRKFSKWVWYDIRNSNIKPYPIGDNQTAPVIQLKGYVYFWSDLWLEDWIRDSFLDTEGSIGFVTYKFTPKIVPSMFTTLPNYGVFKEWISKRIVSLIEDPVSPLGMAFKDLLGEDTKNYNITCEYVGAKELKVVCTKKTGNILSTLWMNKGKFLFAVLLASFLKKKKK